MPKNDPGWRGRWYVYNHERREFLRGLDGVKGMSWTPGVKHATPTGTHRWPRSVPAA